jgi:hypothetical protein
MPSFVRAHPYLGIYLVLLAVVWIVSVATLEPGDGTPQLHPVAQVLQYVIVLVATTLAALRLRIEPDPGRADAVFGFHEMRVTVRDDIDGHTFWTALLVGAAAMTINVLLLAALDRVTGGAGDVATYVGWVGAAIASGVVIGVIGAILAAAINGMRRRIR